VVHFYELEGESMIEKEIRETLEEERIKEIRIVFPNGATKFDVYIDGEKQTEMKSFQFKAEVGELPTYTIERYTLRFLDKYMDGKL